MKKGLKFFLSLLIIPILILNSCNYQKENHRTANKIGRNIKPDIIAQGYEKPN